MKAIERVPLTSLFWPLSEARTIVAAPAPTALLITRFGFQPVLFAIEYAWTATFGVAKMARVSAPDAFSFAI